MKQTEKEIVQQDNVIPMYNPCILCGNEDFRMFRSDERHNGVPMGTPCILCPCGRFASTQNWNEVNMPSSAI